MADKPGPKKTKKKAQPPPRLTLQVVDIQKNYLVCAAADGCDVGSEGPCVITRPAPAGMHTAAGRALGLA
jgi:hypothetical protein